MSDHTPDHTALLATATSHWIEVVANSCSQETLDMLQRGLTEPGLEVAVRIMLRAGAIVLEVSDGIRKTELARVEVEPIRPE